MPDEYNLEPWEKAGAAEVSRLRDEGKPAESTAVLRAIEKMQDADITAKREAKKPDTTATPRGKTTKSDSSTPKKKK